MMSKFIIAIYLSRTKHPKFRDNHKIAARGPVTEFRMLSK
jgi:hypothetical protein